MTQQASLSPTKENKHTLGWIFGVLFLVGGLSMFTSSFISGICILIVGLLLLPPSRKWLEQKIKRTLSRSILIVVSVVLFIVAGVALPGSSTTDKTSVAQDTKQTVEEATNADANGVSTDDAPTVDEVAAQPTQSNIEVAKNKMEKLQGFQTPTVTKVADSNVIYSYIPNDNDSFSVTVNVADSEPGTILGHGEKYPLDRTQNSIDGLEVATGYNEESVLDDGTIIIPNYSSLAFDFEVDGIYYSGEVGSLSAQESKDQLLDILNVFILAVN